MSKLAAALLNVQKADIAIRKDGMNPAFRSRYASLGSVLDEVVPVLNQNGLVLLQFPTQLDGQPALRTKLLHVESGEFEEDTMLLMLGKNDPQGQGSGLTYGRRYAALSILGLVADEDDDGNAATRSAGAASGAPTSTPPPGGGTTEPPAPAGSSFAPPPAVQEKLAENAGRIIPQDGGVPEEVVMTFGKHSGKKLGDLVESQNNYVRWLASEKFEPKTADQRRVKGAAQTLLSLPASEPAAVGSSGASYDDDIPFAGTWA